MRYKENSVIPSRIAKARKTLCMTQGQFAINIREHLPEEDAISAILVSSWETGRRTCRPEIVKIIAKLTGYPEDYFYGKCDENGNPTISPYSSIGQENLMEISPETLYQFDKKPVYVEFMEYQHPNGWALVDYNSKELVFTKYIIKINPRNLVSLRFYEHRPYYDLSQEMLTNKRLDLGTLFTMNRVYVIMNTADPVIRAKYNGWYSHNADRTALQNHIGIVLSYDGLGISYNAYPDVIFKDYSPL